MGDNAIKVMKVSRVLQEENPITEIRVEGLLSNLKEGVQTNGKKYVCGELVDKQFSLNFKKWDYSLEKFMAENSIDLKNTYVVQAVGKFEFYKGEPQLILGNTNLALSCAEERIEEYLDCVNQEKVFNLVDCYEKVLKSLNPVLTEVLDRSIANKTDKFTFAPYSEDYHSERSGYLQHIVNCMLKAGTMRGVPAKKAGDKMGPRADLETIYTAIALYHSGYWDAITVNTNTGVITETDEVALLCFGNSINLTKASVLFAEVEAEKNIKCEKKVNILHSIAALNGLVEPKTLEAITVCNIVRTELSEWESAKKLSTVKPGEKIIYKEGGETKSLVNL